MPSNQFRSPIKLNVPAVPSGVPDEMVETIQGIFNSLRILQQAIGELPGAAYTDLTYLLDNTVSGQFAKALQVQNQQIINVPANGAITTGKLVNLFLNTGVLTARYAIASAMATRAWGWALNTTTAAGESLALAVLSGYNPSFAGLTTGGTYWLSSVTPGGIVNTPPVAAGTIRQEIGLALSTTEMLVHLSPNPVQN